jgi:DMSO/TMAO reductase YedYZ molybdopterin-dependent catalytic subunit
MNKSAKIAIVTFVLLIVAAVPLYYYTRPEAVTEGTLQIKGQVSNPLNVTLSELQSYTPTTIQVTLSSSSRAQDNGVFNYTGVALKDLLSQAQASANATSVYIQAQDGYGTTIPIQDAQNPNTIIAYQKDGAPLTPLKNDGEGPLRLIIGSDQYAQRWVRGVIELVVS